MHFWIGPYVLHVLPISVVSINIPNYIRRWAGNSSDKALDNGLDGPGSIPDVGRVEIFLHCFSSRLFLRTTQPLIKWVQGAFLGVKTAERRTSHPISSYCRDCVYVDPCTHIPLGPSWPAIEVYLCIFEVFKARQNLRSLAHVMNDDWWW